jgi:tryptophan-rich sensory protein
VTPRAVVTLAGAVLLPLAVGALGSLATFDAVRVWYPTLVRPSFAPPAWVFGPVWTALYVMMGVASWLVWRKRHAQPAARGALSFYAVQLLLNLAWSWIFFDLHQPLAALVEITVLLVAIALTTLRFRAVSGAAAALMLPYLAWVSFATALNAGFWWLNR